VILLIIYHVCAYTILYCYVGVETAVRALTLPTATNTIYCWGGSIKALNDHSLTYCLFTAFAAPGPDFSGGLQATMLTL